MRAFGANGLKRAFGVMALKRGTCATRVGPLGLAAPQQMERPMFKFLFRRKPDATVEAIPETQRETFERALAEVNGLVALMDPKPAVTVDPATGAVTFALPEQFPDEALALPAPEPEAKANEQAEPKADAKPKADADPKADAAPKADAEPKADAQAS